MIQRYLCHSYQIHCRSQYAAVLMICMIAADLRAARAEKIYLSFIDNLSKNTIISALSYHKSLTDYLGTQSACLQYVDVRRHWGVSHLAYTVP